jgi:hypothetical protein
MSKTGSVRVSKSEVTLFNHCYKGKEISVTYSKCVILDIQHALRLYHIVICGLSGFATRLHITSQNGTIFEKKRLFSIKHVFLYSLKHFSEIFFTLRRTQQDVIINAKYSLLFWGF